jgi:Putative zinc-finger
MPLNPFEKANYAIIRLIVRVMPSCRDVSELVSRAMDERLSLRKRLSIRLHLSMCSLCRRYEKQLRLLRQATQHYADPEENEVEASLSPEAKARLEKALEDGGK